MWFSYVNPHPSVLTGKGHTQFANVNLLMRWRSSHELRFLLEKDAAINETPDSLRPGFSLAHLTPHWVSMNAGHKHDNT